tara:strand:+ start:2283 stop:2465 length:183 start_codon:yes stop_codon:yes gene_type:complete
MLFLDRSTPKPVYYMLALGELSKGCLLARLSRIRVYSRGIEFMEDALDVQISELQSELAE